MPTICTLTTPTTLTMPIMIMAMPMAMTAYDSISTSLCPTSDDRSLGIHQIETMANAMTTTKAVLNGNDFKVRTAVSPHKICRPQTYGFPISVRGEVVREGDAYILCHALGELPRNVAPGTVGSIWRRHTRGDTHVNSP